MEVVTEFELRVSTNTVIILKTKASFLKEIYCVIMYPK
jgi:hypothetical protein